MSKIIIELPFLPPSVNSCYRSVGSRVYKSKRLREYENTMSEYFEIFHKNFEMLKGGLSLDVAFNLKGKRSIDLDNMLKALIDGLEGRCFENDKMIMQIRARKINNCKEPHTSVTLCQLDSSSPSDDSLP